MDVQNSMAHAIWMARTFLRFFRTPELKMATYHNLNAPPFELIDRVDQTSIRRVPFYVYIMVVHLLEWAKYTAPVRFEGGPEGVLDGQYFADDDGNRSVLLVNASGREQLARLPLSSGTALSAEILGSEDVAASNGYSRAFSPSLREQKHEAVTPHKYAVKRNILSLPPFAVAVLSWNEDKRQ